LDAERILTPGATIWGLRFGYPSGFVVSAKATQYSEEWKSDACSVRGGRSTVKIDGKEFEKIESISLDLVENKIRPLFARCPLDFLEQVIEEKVKFLDTIALTELVRRGKRTENDQWDHVTNILSQRKGI